MEPALSIIIPIYNEAGNITPLYNDIVGAVGLKNTEIIFINDGSTDDSLEELKKLAGITIIDLNRRYGQSSAFDAGFKAAQAPIVVTLDGDGQNDPRDIPLLVRTLKEKKVDVVAGWRQHREERAGIKILSKMGRSIRHVFIGDQVHDSGCTLRVYTRDAAKSLDIGGEMHRYILAILRWNGFRIVEAPVNDRPRLNGRSKYGYSKAVRGFIDLVYVWFVHKYSERPIHFFGYMSIGAFLVGVAAGATAIYQKIALGLSLSRNGYFFIASTFLLSSIIFFSFGIVLDFLIRIHLNNSPYEKRYYIRSITQTIHG